MAKRVKNWRDKLRAKIAEYQRDLPPDPWEVARQLEASLRAWGYAGLCREPQPSAEEWARRKRRTAELQELVAVVQVPTERAKQLRRELALLLLGEMLDEVIEICQGVLAARSRSHKAAKYRQ